MARRRLFFQLRRLNTYQTKIFLLNFGFVLLFLILVSRLFYLQVLHRTDFIKQAEAIHETSTVIQPARGLIYCQDKNQNLIPIALNKKYYLLYANPKEITDAQATSQVLSKILALPNEEIYQHLIKRERSYEIIVKKIDDEAMVNQIKQAKLAGIYLTEESYRYYPFNNFASQTIGFVAEDEKGFIKGRYGLENYYDDILSGRSGVFYGVRDAFGRLIRSVFSKEQEVQEGNDLITTLDKNIQFQAENILKTLITSRRASKGSLIVMEIPSGKILALANYPDFNLNEFNKEKDYSVFRNYAVEDRYEPGSIVKTLTMAAGLDLKLVTPTTTYTDIGYFKVGGHTLVNYNNEVYGKNVTMTRVLERSINTGAIFVGEKVGIANLRQYFKQFGLNQKTGIDLPNEMTGDLSNLEYPKASPTHLATASFGLGIAVTPFELLKAYSAVANKGLMITPYLVEAIRNKNGTVTKMPVTEPQRVLEEKTAETLSNMLVSVVENGFGINTKIKGYSTGGKTGTAFIPQGNGYSQDMIHTYIGYFPASQPKFLILVKMDRPMATSDSASHTVTIAFRQMEQYLIDYFNIPPDEL